MKRDEDALAKALAGLKQQGLSNPPPEEVMDETIRRLAEAQARIPPGERTPDGTVIRPAFSGAGIRLALAAAALLMLGYAVGRLAAPAPPDLDEIRDALTPSLAASIEPVIREKVVEDLRERYELALVATYVRVKEELTQQYRDDMNRLAVETLAASNAVTNRLLEGLVEAVKVRQVQDRQQVAVALKEIEARRLEDSTRLGHAMLNLAVQTENRLQRTREDVVRLLADTEPVRPPANDENPDHLN